MANEEPLNLFDQMVAACRPADEGNELLGRIRDLVQRDLASFKQQQFLDKLAQNPVQGDPEQFQQRIREASAHNFYLTDDQIRELLKLVPATFPEDWESADKPQERWSGDQKGELKNIFAMPGGGPVPICEPKAVEFVIKRAVQFRDKCRQKAS